jgi:PIN domain nuclease of toxin-antitoxin system
VARGLPEVNSYAADTHALFWYLTASPRLGTGAKRAFDEGANGEATIYLSAIVLAELYYMNEKLGRPLDFEAEMQRLSVSGQFVLVAFLPEETLDFSANRAVPEMHDRIIVGIARRLQVPLLTRDPQIVGSNLVPTIW